MKLRRIPKGYESVDGIILTEPRIEAIRRELQDLLSVVQLEVDGMPVEIDGFRLKDMSHWADNSTSLSDIFWHLSSVCNFSCEFCYEKGNPEDFPIRNTPRMATRDEVSTRLAHYDPARGTGIFTVRSSINEPFVNKRAIEYLRLMRAACSDELMTFVTNGFYLKREVVEELSQLGPLFFNLSIYSTDDEVRKRVLRDHRGAASVAAVEHLDEFNVPYMANLVMWPSIPFEDMERTIAFMAEHNATLLRVCLGGYSRYLKGDFERFELDEYWPKVVAAVEELRGRYRIPLLVEPNSYVRPDAEALVDGVIRDSPSDLAGVRRGDRVVTVDGVRVLSRMHLLSLLRKKSQLPQYRAPGLPKGSNEGRRQADTRVRLEIARADKTFEVTIDRYDPRSMATHPYAEIADFNDFVHGLIVTDGLRYSSLKAARALMAKHDARRVLLLTSPLIRPVVDHMLGQVDAFAGFEVDIRVPRNDYFGGTINIGDLMVVEDFVTAIREYVEESGKHPDLVLLPASPFASSPWMRDLTGRPWTDIERLTGLKVDLIPCSTITF